MRALLILISLLSFGLEADVNLVCQKHTVTYHDDNTVELANGEYAITIDEIAKRLYMDEVPYMGYESEGTVIKFRYAETRLLPQTGILSILNIFLLSKVTGKLLHEIWFSKENKKLDSIQKLNTEYFYKGYTFESKCENVIPLF